MDMIVLETRKLSTDKVNHVVNQIFKQPTTHIVLTLIQIFMCLNTYLGRPLRRQTPDLLLNIVVFLIDTDPINLLLNGVLAVLEHVLETWGKSAVLVPVVCIAIVFIASTSVRTYGKA